MPSGARAAANLEIGIADDAALLGAPDEARARALVAAWRDLGIDSVRLFAEWQKVAPAPGARDAPAGFDESDPDDPGYDWGRVDRAVEVVRAAGMRVNLVVTGPGPLWATRNPASGDERLAPRADSFARYARAVALRYGGRVDRYILWNEPNLPLWLKPQFTCRGARCTPASPRLYRALVRAAYPAIKAVDARATVLFGVLAPRGQNPTARNASMRPLTFLRALACVDRRLRRMRTGPCRGFAPLTADAFSYHPHSTRRPPDRPSAQRDEATIADLPRLKRVLDGAQRAGGLRKPGGGRFTLWFTEYGYQTRPPDPGGVSLLRQSRWLQQASYIAWRDPRVRNLTQYVWRDEPIRRGTRSPYAGWQSGLRFIDGRAKPSLRSFPDPFFVDLPRRSQRARLWGQVRPGTTAAVTVQRRRGARGPWRTVRRLRTTARGFFTLRQTVRAATDYRFRWVELDDYGAPLGTRSTSEVVHVRPRR